MNRRDVREGASVGVLGNGEMDRRNRLDLVRTGRGALTGYLVSSGTRESGGSFVVEFAVGRGL